MDKKYLSKMTIGGQQYDLKDAEARQSIADIQTSITGGMHYIGETSTVLTDGASTSTLVAKSEGSLAKTTGFEAGDIVIYGELEFVWNGAKWQEFGSTGSLKSLAFKDNATGDVACAGTNSSSAVTFTGGSTETVLKAVDDEAVAPSFTEGAFSAGELPSFTEGAFTPASLGTGFVTAGTAPSYSHSGFSGGSLGEASTGNFATAGVTASVDESNEIVTFAAASTASAVTAQGAFTPASYGTDSFSAGTPTAIDVTKFNGGSKAADTFSAGVLPSKAADTFSAGSAATFTTETVVKSIGTGTAAAQTFNGSTVSVTVA
jgi:hypothetical protein